MSTPTRKSLLAQLGDLRDALRHHLVREASSAYVDVWPEPSDFLASWARTPAMSFSDFEATGSLQATEDMVLAELSLRYLHDDSADNDRDVQVAIVRVTEGDLWLVVDLFRDPETDEARADPSVLRGLCAACTTAPRRSVSAYVLGNG